MRNNWIRALRYYTLKRLRTEYTNPVTTENKGKYELIFISGNPRFTLKEGVIYGSDKHGNINKKECYGNVNDWKQWDWSGYYPFKRCLYDWKKEKRKVSKSKRPYTKPRKREIEILATILPTASWPYSNTDGSGNRSIE